MSILKFAKGKGFKLNTVWILSFVLVCIFIILSILSPERFLNPRNFRSLLRLSSFFGIVAVGMNFVIASGGIDLSVASIISMISMFIACIIPPVGHFWHMLGFALLIGTACGFVNGLLITWIGVSPFIATLGTGMIYSGFGYLTVNAIVKRFTNNVFGFLGNYNIGGIFPLSFLILIVIVCAGWYILKCTVFGRNLYALGSNPKAAHYAGINEKREILIVYLISGLLAGLSSVIATSQIGGGNANIGQGADLDAITAVVMGGGSLAGGNKGSILGTFIGFLLLRVISNGMNLLSIGSYWQMIFRGTILIIAVVIDALRTLRYKSI
jgi:ribose/xylose/arabinose/galactoside ABC-type transport system permease subunit